LRAGEKLADRFVVGDRVIRQIARSQPSLRSSLPTCNVVIAVADEDSNHALTNAEIIRNALFTDSDADKLTTRNCCRRAGRVAVSSVSAKLGQKLHSTAVLCRNVETPRYTDRGRGL
jgi:hypothetical protein